LNGAESRWGQLKKDEPVSRRGSSSLPSLRYLQISQVRAAQQAGFRDRQFGLGGARGENRGEHLGGNSGTRAERSAKQSLQAETEARNEAAAGSCAPKGIEPIGGEFLAFVQLESFVHG
jgi:hypothetical protein